MPVVGTKAAASAQGFGEFTTVSGPATYIEDVFSTWLYTGNGSTQTITNGIDLAGKGGMVWGKARNFADNHVLIDTARGASNYLSSNNTLDQQGSVNGLTAFNSNGFSVGSANTLNNSSRNYASWTFRKQPKFFDVVTYTGNGTAGRTVAHNLGSTPGCIIVKATSAANDWLVYHTSLGNTQGMSISSTSAAATSTTYWNNTSPTSTQFTVGTSPRSNENGTTFVAYLFAHNAGGFGLTGTDNVISCGSFTTDGSGNATVNLGYEPQFIILKETNGTRGWDIFDVMRGMSVGSATSVLQANTANAETAPGIFASPTSTGFQFTMNVSKTYIYIAIRRGPMKVPTNGTSVFKPTAYTGNGSTTTVNAGFPVDLSITRIRDVIGQTLVVDRLRGASQRLFADSTTDETTSASAVTSLASNTSITFGVNGDTNSSGKTYVTWDLQRAPGFFDEVIVVTNGQTAPITSTHNLTVVPEMMIGKKRGPTGGIGDWSVYHKGLNGGVNPQNYRIRFNKDFAAGAASGVWNNTAPTATQFTIGTDGDVNSGTAGDTSVFWLFASCPGVSKVGSYTGTGATQTISCGFAARFVLIKRTDSTGNWWVWDTARGMVAGTDPRLASNSTAAELNADWVYTDASGFQIVTTDASVNASGGSYIYLAIA